MRSPTPFYSKAQLKVSLANLVVEAGPSAFDWGDYNWLPTGHATRPGELVKAADFVNSVRSVAPSLYVEFKDLRDVISDLEMEYRTINAQRKPDFARSKAERALTVLHHVRRCMTADKLDAACSKVTKLQARRLLEMCRPVDESAPPHARLQGHRCVLNQKYPWGTVLELAEFMTFLRHQARP